MPWRNISRVLSRAIDRQFGESLCLSMPLDRRGQPAAKLNYKTTNPISVSSHARAVFGPAVASSPSAAPGLGEGSRSSERLCNFVFALGFDCTSDESWCDGCGGYGASSVARYSG